MGKKKVDPKPEMHLLIPASTLPRCGINSTTDRREMARKTTAILSRTSATSYHPPEKKNMLYLIFFHMALYKLLSAEQAAKCCTFAL